MTPDILEEKNEKLQELQFLEQNLQNIIFQRELFQTELTEAQAALKELASSDGDAFKLIGQIMIKADKSRLREELLDKEKILNIRLKTIKSQETSLTKRLEQIRSEFIDLIK